MCIYTKGTIMNKLKYDHNIIYYWIYLNIFKFELHKLKKKKNFHEKYCSLWFFLCEFFHEKNFIKINIL